MIFFIHLTLGTIVESFIILPQSAVDGLFRVLSLATSIYNVGIHTTLWCENIRICPVVSDVSETLFDFSQLQCQVRTKYNNTFETVLQH